MTPINALRMLSLAGLGPLLCIPVLAQESPYFYGGLSVGQSRAKIDEQRITDSVVGAGLATTSLNTDERDRAYKLFGGYQINRNFCVELGYFDLGTFNFSSTTSPTGTLDGQIRLKGANLDLVGTLPLTEHLSALGRVGATYIRTRDAFVGSGAAVVAQSNPSERGSNYKVGAGLQYELSRSAFVRADAERYRANDAVGGRANVNLYSLSLVFPFSRDSLPAPRSSKVQDDNFAPIPVASSTPVQALPRAQVPVAQVELPVAVPALRRVSFSAESMFTFDQSALRPEGAAALDIFTRELQGMQYELITVEGHTDRLGTQAYNQTLSLQRAEAVKAYLVSSGKISPSRISAVGKSEAGPVTKRDDCLGGQASAKLIACLQPDRRVEVEVVGRR